MQDATTREYTAEYDSARLRDRQQETHNRVVRQMLRRHDAGEVLSDEEYEFLTKHG